MKVSSVVVADGRDGSCTYTVPERFLSLLLEVVIMVLREQKQTESSEGEERSRLPGKQNERQT